MQRVNYKNLQILVSLGDPGTNTWGILRDDHSQVFGESEVICDFSAAWWIGTLNIRVQDQLYL